MQSVIVWLSIVGGALLAWHMWLLSKAGSPFSAACGCGHAAAFHRDEGGCRHTHDGSVDCYGYCTCTRSADQVEARLVWADE